MPFTHPHPIEAIERPGEAGEGGWGRETGAAIGAVAIKQPVVGCLGIGAIAAVEGERLAQRCPARGDRRATETAAGPGAVGALAIAAARVGQGQVENPVKHQRIANQGQATGHHDRRLIATGDVGGAAGMAGLGIGPGMDQLVGDGAGIPTHVKEGFAIDHLFDAIAIGVLQHLEADIGDVDQGHPGGHQSVLAAEKGAGPMAQVDALESFGIEVHLPGQQGDGGRAGFAQGRVAPAAGDCREIANCLEFRRQGRLQVSQRGNGREGRLRRC